MFDRSVCQSEYLEELSSLDDESLERECYSMIDESFHLRSHLDSVFHWKVKACRDESRKRDPEGSIYERALANFPDAESFASLPWNIES
jgi:hypothetical protein